VGLDGEKLSEIKEPIPFTKGERVRVKLVNDTMMSHPIHLHGHFFELVTGHGDYAPRKHTVMVQPSAVRSNMAVTIDGRAYPSTDTVHMKLGETLKVRFIGSNNGFIHPMHIHGGPFTVVARDGETLAPSARFQADTINIGPGQRYDLDRARARQMVNSLPHRAPHREQQCRDKGRRPVDDGDRRRGVIEGAASTTGQTPEPSPPDPRARALSRWENEGGAEPDGAQQSKIGTEARPHIPELTNTDLVQLRIRVIALENLLIALLAGASERQLETARAMSAYIVPRPGVTHHPLTIAAAAQMNDLVARSDRFRP